MTCPVTEYAEAVRDNNILACKWVKLACKRHLDDIEDVKSGRRNDIKFSDGAVKKALEFFTELQLWKGKENKGKEYTLAPHFQFITGCIMGWQKSDDTRRFRTAYIEMGRKGAKSSFAGALSAYFLVADGESGAECYSAAVKRDQAKIVWTNTRNFLKTSLFAKRINFHVNNLSHERSWSKCEPLSSETKSLDGLDTHFASLDELHAHPTPEVHDLVVDSVGARSQPLILIITTAGFDQAGICYQRREYLTKILKGTIQDDSFFGMIYTLDTKRDWPELLTLQEKKDGKKGTVEDDWTDESMWFKPMPGLCGETENGIRYGLMEDGTPAPGYMTKIEDVRQKAQYAKEQVAAINNFLTKRCNIWVSQHSRWISLELWDQNNTKSIYVTG